MFDFLKPKVLEEADSTYSGHIRVVKSSGDIYIATGPLTQSGSLVGEVWDGTLKKFGQKNKTWLILGLAGGTIATMISKRFTPARITGIEIDPIMVTLGSKYLNVDKIPSIEIITMDAKKFLQQLPKNQKYDYVLVDMYLGDKLPEFVYSDSFLKQMRDIGTTVIFNHLFYDEPKRTAAGILVGKLKQLFPRVTMIRKLTNLLITCQSGVS